MSRPSTKQLEFFVAVATLGSFRRAAEELQTTQPTITTQIANIESLLKVKLFERGRTGVLLTPAGRHLLPHVRGLLGGLDALVEEARETRGEAALFKLGVKSTVGPYLLPSILPQLQTRFPQLKLHVREELPVHLEPLLLRGELDLIVSAYPPNSSEIAGERLFREDIKLVLPAYHPLAAKPKLKGADLAGQRLLVTEDGHFFTRMVERLASRYGAEIDRGYRGTSLDAIRSMVLMGTGIAFLPSMYIDTELKRNGALVVRQLVDDRLARIIGLSWRANAPSRPFYRELAQAMRTLIRQGLGDSVQVLDPLQ